MDDTTILGGALNQLGQTVKQTAKQITKAPKELTKDADEQIEGVKKTEDTEKKPDEQKQIDLKQNGWNSDEERIMFLKKLYGYNTSYGEDNKNKLDELKNEKPSEFEEQIKNKTPEEKMKLADLRNQLHKENYYDPTFNPVKKQEERPAEKVENEKKQEMMELQKKEEKKPQPIAVVREQNKAEMFRGPAG